MRDISCCKMQGKEEEELFYEQKQRDDVGLKT